ncbi:restriction endonuclease subunit S [Enterobacter kobei]|uniref:restriction endonuclease subunit S n=1 Tax=Enterobacter kobei TaxID=208224 RepID=UPI001865FB33|nr:restriction endonuclease subunit S [Enterobacter kobei]HCR1067715.1 restriction endonuclease subunit S [Enterobacter kobei]
MSFEFIETELGNFVEIVTKKCDASIIDVTNYISTENMLPDRQGVTISSGIPDVNKFNSFEIGDTLFSNIRTYFKKVWFATFYGGVSPDVLVFRTTHEKLTSEYLHLILSSDDFINYSHLTSKGAKMPRGDKGAMLSYKIKIPSLKYQKRCTKLIFTLSKKIDSNNRINQTLEQMAQALFKSWFVDFEPVKAKMAALEAGGSQEGATLAAMTAISGKEADALVVFEREHPEKYAELKATAELFPSAMQESELGEIPEGWLVKPLGDSLEIKRGGSPRPIKDFIRPTGYPWVKIADATASTSPFLFKTSEFIKEEGLKKTVYLRKGDLILSNSATPGLPKFLQLDACIHDGWLYFPKISNYTDTYLYFLFLKIRRELVAKGNGSVFTNLKTDILREHLAVLPEYKIVNRFSVLALSYLDAIKANELTINSLSCLRDTLLPKLLSGEITLPEAEQVVSEAENV